MILIRKPWKSRTKKKSLGAFLNLLFADLAEFRAITFFLCQKTSAAQNGHKQDKTHQIFFTLCIH